jgi:branched-chain amino acid transport system permease protein
MITIDMIVDGLLSGIILGGIYSLMSCGLTLIWGTVGILNFAHGAIITTAGYTSFLILSIFGSFPFAIILATFFAFILGMILEILIFRPLRGKENAEMNSIYASLAVAIILENVLLLAFGPRRKPIPPVIIGTLNFGGYTITIHKLIVILISLCTLTAFLLFIKKSKYGMAMRAVAQNLLESKLMGINTDRIYLLTVGTGCAIAGVSGPLLGSLYYLWPTFGDLPLIKAFIIIVFGGLGDIRGTICAAFILGIVESYAGLFLGMGWALPIMFLFMCLTLLFKPSGIFGRGM